MKQSIHEIHKYYNVFKDEIKIAVMQQYAKTSKQWKFVGYRCRHCDGTLKTVNSVEKHKTTCREINTIKKDKDMPIQVIMVKGERMYRWGDSGKAYKTRAEAEKQAQAAYASGYKEKKEADKK